MEILLHYSPASLTVRVVTVLQKYLANEILIAAGSTQKKSCPENQIRTRDLANTEVTVTLLFHNIN